MDLGFFVGYLIVTLIALAILYAVIRAAVRAALEDHYKIVRWYEHTGEWRGKHKPRDFPLSPASEAPVPGAPPRAD